MILVAKILQIILTKQRKQTTQLYIFQTEFLFKLILIKLVFNTAAMNWRN